jgi:hypothetical protein
MTTLDRIISAAKTRSYQEARRQGLSSQQAEDEAFMVAQFIKDQTLASDTCSR